MELIPITATTTRVTIIANRATKGQMGSGRGSNTIVGKTSSLTARSTSLARARSLTIDDGANGSPITNRRGIPLEMISDRWVRQSCLFRRFIAYVGFQIANAAIDG